MCILPVTFHEIVINFESQLKNSMVLLDIHKQSPRGVLEKGYS